MFGYFLFWTAFYVLRGGQTRPDAAPAHAAPRYGHLAPSLGTVRKVGGSSLPKASCPKSPVCALSHTQCADMFVVAGMVWRAASGDCSHAMEL